MEVAAGPTFGLKDHVGLPVLLHGEKEKKLEELAVANGRRSSGFCFVGQEEAVSSESSSIGAESSSEAEERKDGGEDEVQSKLTEGPLGSLDSLEESLPIKRGLSNFFTGKSKSFASLSDVADAAAGELAKPENPFNKRRRILNACSKPSAWARRASCSSLLPPLPPLTALEGEDDEDEEAEGSGGDGDSPLPPLPMHHHHGTEERKVKRAFRSPRSFSLSDLQRA